MSVIGPDRDIQLAVTGTHTTPTGRTGRRMLTWCPCGWHGRTHGTPAPAWVEGIKHVCLVTPRDIPPAGNSV